MESDDDDDFDYLIDSNSQVEVGWQKEEHEKWHQRASRVELVSGPFARRPRRPSYEALLETDDDEEEGPAAEKEEQEKDGLFLKDGHHDDDDILYPEDGCTAAFLCLPPPYVLFSMDESYHEDLRKQLTKRRDVVISSLGSFSAAYNIVNISLAMVSMNIIYPIQGDDFKKSWSASAMFAGMVVGQLGFGFIGDSIGLVRAFRLTMLLQMAGAIGSALIYMPAVYIKLVIARFILGIGAGGVYPLAASVASNSSEKGQSDTTVALVFSLQGVAFVTMNAFATFLAYNTTNSSLIFRLLLGMGALPGLFILLMEWMEKRIGSEEDDDGHTRAPGAREASHLLQEALRDPLIIKRLIGCSLTWFLYDVCFFGNVLFQPIIGNSIFGGSGSLRLESRTSLVLALLALPGYFIAVALIKPLGPKYIQTQGFVLCAALYLVLALFGQRLIDEGLGGIALIIYGLSFTFFNFGPGATTYLFPSKLFPKKIKSSLNGLAAAAGKIGGFLGGYMFPPLLAHFGLEVVLILCCIISLVGAITTMATLDTDDAMVECPAHHDHLPYQQQQRRDVNDGADVEQA